MNKAIPVIVFFAMAAAGLIALSAEMPDPSGARTILVMLAMGIVFFVSAVLVAAYYKRLR